MTIPGGISRTKQSWEAERVGGLKYRQFQEESFFTPKGGEGCQTRVRLTRKEIRVALRVS